MEPDLIDAYVAALRRRMRWRADADDVADEVADHLREAAGRLTRQGLEPAAAQRETLARFGDVTLVADAFAAEQGVAVLPTRFTRAAGLCGPPAAAAWTASAVVGAGGGHTDLLVPWSLVVYGAWVVLLAFALALTSVTLAGALVRTGRLHRPSGSVALGLCVLLVAGMPLLGWAVTSLVGFLGAAVLVALRGPVGDVAAVRPLRWLALWPAGAAAQWFFDEVLPVGRTDEYGDHPVAWLVPFVVCALGSAAALARAGTALRAEESGPPGVMPPGPFTPATT